MNNEGMPKPVATARMDGILERGRPLKRWNNEVEEDLKTMGIRNWLRVARKGRNVGGLYWMLYTVGCSASGRGGEDTIV